MDFGTAIIVILSMDTNIQVMVTMTVTMETRCLELVITITTGPGVYKLYMKMMGLENWIIFMEM